MSEIWNDNSSIEEKSSTIVTPQLNQLKQRFSVMDIYNIINKYRYDINLEEYDYEVLCWFIDSEYAERFSELINYIKDLFGDKLKDKYFKITLDKNKNKIQKYHYDLISKYFFENELVDSNFFKDYLYDVMVKIPEIFNSDMLSKEYKEKINKILPESEILIKDQESSSLSGESMNVESTDLLYQKGLVDSNLKNEILKDMPSEYSNLEKSIYIYIKLCQLLSYDQNYYANKNKYKSEHQNFENISKIDKDNNNVICYEFVTIYSEMLKDLGINVAATTKYDYDVNEEGNWVISNFADNHANLKYSVDGMTIFADSTTSVLGGDIINAKLNNPLNGLQCLSVEQDKKLEFSNALNKVYNNLKKDNNTFKKYDKDVTEKPLVDKLKILFDDIRNTDFNSTDFISYITSVKHKLFSNDELDWNLKISYIGKNIDGNQYPVVLFSVNTNDIKNVPQDTIQYMYDSQDKKVTKMEKEELERMFYEGELFFIDENINIPNINIVNSGRAL